MPILDAYLHRPDFPSYVPMLEAYLHRSDFPSYVPMYEAYLHIGFPSHNCCTERAGISLLTNIYQLLLYLLHVLLFYLVIYFSAIRLIICNNAMLQNIFYSFLSES